MKQPSDTSQALAISNALSSIRRDKYFPDNVFSGHWKDYLFFQPHMMFDVCFMDAKDLLLREDNASVIALINLGNSAVVNDSDSSVVFLWRDTGAMEYMARLKGDGSAMNWMFLMDRYICAADAGKWAIYCEKENDVAVFALGESFSESTSSRVGMLLNAKSIKSSGNSEEGQLFDFGKLVPSWKVTLMTEYAPDVRSRRVSPEDRK